MKQRQHKTSGASKARQASRASESTHAGEMHRTLAALETSREALRRSERLRAQAEKMGKVGGWEFDIDTRKQVWTEMVYRIHEVDLGYQPTVEAGINFYAPSSRPIIQRAVQRAIELGEPFDVELELVTAKGHRRHVHAIGGADLARRKIFGFFQDITDRKRLENRMKRFSQEIIAAREEERRRVAAVLHHDVGSMAVGVSANLEAIEEDLLEGKPGDALRRLKKARKLFAQSVARLKGVAAQLRPPELDVVGLRGALRQHFAQLSEHRGVHIHFKEALGRRSVCGDTATILFRSAQEALTNAIKHGHAKRVDVALAFVGENIVLTIRDNGKGFDPARLATRTTMHMGLRVLQEMVASAGGEVKVDATVDRGVLVRVSLPAASAGPAPDRTAARVGLGAAE